MVRRVWLWLAAALLLLPAGIAETGLSLRQLQHTAWSSKDGAPMEITSLAQASDGAIWIGTTTGLFRFNGFEFRPWEPPSSGAQMMSRNISALFSESDGTLWIGYRFGGISRLKNGRLTNYDGHAGLPPGDIQEIAHDAHGAIWAVAANRLMELQGEHWLDRSAAVYKSGVKQPIEHFLFDRDGCLWVAVFDHITALQQGGRRCGATRQSVGYVTGFAQASSGKIWLSDYWRPVGQLALSDRKPLHIARTQSLGANSLLFTSDGALWVATVKHGITRRPLSGDRVQAAAEESFGEKDGLTSGQTTALLEDREGNLWVGTSRGLDRFSKPKVAPWQGPSLHGSPALALKAGGGVWVADPFFRLFSSGRDGVREARFGEGAYALYSSPSGTLWAATPKYLLRYQNNQATRYPVPPGTADLIVQSMVEDPAGDLLVAFTYSGLWRLSHGKWTRSVPGLPRITPVSMMIDSHRRIWFGYVDGSAKMWDGTRAVSIPISENLGQLLVFYESKDSLWVGGSKGLAVLIGTSFHSVASTNPRGLQGVSGIARSRSGDLWLNGANGIVRIPADEVSHALANPAYRMNSELFDYHDGVTGHAPQLRPLSSAVADDDGHIWFATSGSALYVDPEHLPRNTVPPLVSVEGVAVDGVRFEAGEPFRLNAHPHKLQVSYIGVSLSSPDRVQYRYQLEPEDAGWQDGGSDRVASYTNLAPGNYRFRVSARNNDGVWSQDAAIAAFSVPPAFTQTTAFATSCVLVAIALLWLLYALRLRYVTARIQERMRERTAERLRIARDLHDTLLQGVQGLIMRLHFTAGQMPEQDATRRMLMSALDRADEVLEESRDSLLQLRSEEGADTDLSALLLQLSSQLRRSSEAAFTFVVEGEARPVHPIVREEVSFIFREAFTNALKHSGAKTMAARLIYSTEELRLVFSDDGIGLSTLVQKSQRRQGHWGLQGMRERAARIGGRIHLSGAPDAGTTVDLRVPGGAAYLPDRPFSRWKRALRAFTSWRPMMPAKRPQ